MLSLDSDSSRWLLFYFPVSWLTQFGHGLVTTVVGPTQPYLAKNVNVNIDTINFVWTFGFFGYLIGSLATSFIFKQYVRSATAKLIFLNVTILLTGIFMIVLPFTSSFSVLVVSRLIQNLALGAFVTADASLIVFLIGPEKSRPFTMALHALIGAGFLVATFLVRPFLPKGEDIDKNQLCKRGNTTIELPTTDQLEDGLNQTVTASPTEDLLIPTIAWPFIISGCWCIIFSLGFLLLARLPYKMPNFYDSNSSEDTEVSNNSIKHWYIFLILIFFYYFTSCGVERIFQPMASTFGLCGPLDLSPSAAVLTDSCYNGGFMCGRIISALIAGFIAPRNMIIFSLIACVGASILLVLLAGTSTIGLYAGTAILGFFISWQFGACFSWVAKKINITGRVSSIFFIGCGAGSLVMPPVVGFAFTSILGAMSIIYLTLGFCILQCLLFAAMWSLARIPNNSPNSYNLAQIK